MFLLCSIQWCQPLHSATIFSASQFPDLPPSLAASLKDLDALMDMFKELQIDPAEFACLKAVVLFKPGPYLSLIEVILKNILLEVAGLKDKKEIENLQDQSLSMLQQQVSSQSQMVASDRLGTRFARFEQ